MTNTKVLLTLAALLAAVPATAQTAFDLTPVGDGQLGAIAGREDLAQIAESRSTATVAGNSIGDNSVTGDALISDQAFQNISGLTQVNINTGNDVAINASMNVNIAISGPQ